MSSQCTIVFRHAETGEDLGILTISKDEKFELGQSVSIPTNFGEEQLNMLYVIESVLDSIVLCRDAKF